jgi:hypothetical protein
MTPLDVTISVLHEECPVNNFNVDLEDALADSTELVLFGDAEVTYTNAELHAFLDNDASGGVNIPARGGSTAYSEDDTVIVGVRTLSGFSHTGPSGVDMTDAVIDDRFSTVIKEARLCPLQPLILGKSQPCPVNNADTHVLVSDGIPYTAAMAAAQGLDNMFGVDFSRGGEFIGNRDGGYGDVLGCKHLSLGLSTGGLSGMESVEKGICKQGLANGVSTNQAEGCNWNLDHGMAECNGGVGNCAGKAFDALAFSARVLRDDTDSASVVTEWQVDVTTLSYDCERVNRAESRGVSLRGVERRHTSVLTRSSGDGGGSSASTAITVVAARDAEEPSSDGVHAGHAGDDTGAHSHDASAAAIVACCIGGVLLLIVSVHLVQVHALGVKGLLSAESKARFEKKRRVDQKFNDQPSALLVPRKMIVPGRM